MKNIIKAGIISVLLSACATSPKTPPGGEEAADKPSLAIRIGKGLLGGIGTVLKGAGQGMQQAQQANADPITCRNNGMSGMLQEYRCQ